MIDKETILHVANLARLELKDSEVESLKEDLGKILNYFITLNDVNTDDVEPTFHPFPINNVFREDIVKKSFPVEEILSNAPDRTLTYFLVPRIVEEKNGN
ncbi:aspartyl/glutamyl-tRNA(Asn/Gln) amidotransferase subunit C [Thermodesulfobium acidiphilum]|uniref:Aspartyl/glutamyl-tRNA(Asn/Gln) amidotransferase subunit C n=1 Tax=Thermodesulfobium acidiphilum TaxID=1794699 RepID=A0A2R4VZK1_THEAF|nr:Asp-tRNA(Asn)/Glu-tRNA(Gln) amidotransferase subunit GatC [Thermodesulfobium acidiphilum]AWB09969.1 aspartyl/glutamyl-tRNA(Asn/Gln) amidotransferase subunit C [Thermodesulfobium acidiphilum]PMP84632.1 MAG: Asp-tRNA(Asn)/Glu-tRNA(Gln) amidotransferase GatCAB subunit C [Thermodesulfobium narugense]